MINKYFKSEGAKYIFALIAMDGKSRNKLIGLTEELYDDKELAEEWKNNIERTILSIDGSTSDTLLALERLNDIYENIMEVFKDNKED